MAAASDGKTDSEVTSLEITTGSTLLMDGVITSEYMGPPDATSATGDVFLELSSVGEADGTFYTVLLDLFMAIPDDPDHMVIPEGTYTLSDGWDAFTCNSEYTHAKHKPAGTWIAFGDGAATISRTGNKYTVTGDFTTEDGVPFTFEYTGPIPLSNSEPQPLDLIESDVEETFATVTEAAYLGDFYGNGTAVFQTLFTNGDTRLLAEFITPFVYYAPDALPAGTYPIADSYMEGTLLMGTQINVGGWEYQPRGTYCNVNNLFGLAAQGTATVEKTGEGYVLAFDLKDANGYRIAAAYSGPITFGDYTGGM